MRRIQEIEIELPQIVQDHADAAYAQIRQQASQEKQPAGRRVRSFPRAAGILLAVGILSVTAVSATAAGIVGYRRYLAERMTDISADDLLHLEMVAEQGNVTAEFNRELTARERSVYEQLTGEYEADGKYPTGQIRELAEDENYSGSGVAARSTPGKNMAVSFICRIPLSPKRNGWKSSNISTNWITVYRKKYGSRNIPTCPILTVMNRCRMRKSMNCMQCFLPRRWISGEWTAVT